MGPGAMDGRSVGAGLASVGCVKVVDGEADGAASQRDEGDGDRAAVLVDAVHLAGSDAIDWLVDLDHSRDFLGATRTPCQVPERSCAGSAADTRKRVEMSNKSLRIGGLSG